MSENKTNVFNPVKEETDGVRARRVIWSTAALDAALKGLDDGRKLVANPFYENNPRLLKGDLVFKHTKEELDEWRKCCNDIIYFANTYCKLMTPEGIRHIKLRDYQEEYLKHLVDHDMSIMLSARQAGKCVELTTKALVKLDQKFFDIYGEDFKVEFEKYKTWRIDESDVYEIPMFELLNIFEQSKVWKLKYGLYKKIYYNSRLSSLYLKFISWLDKFKKSDFKFIKSHIVEGLQVKTDTGFSNVSEINLTMPYEIYKIELENGLKLNCADTHIVFKSNMDMMFVQDLKLGDVIQTIYGSSKVIDVERLQSKVCMCDLSIDDFNNRYFTNGILSHNTTTSSIFILHFILFNTDKNVLILGNKFRTAKDILDKFKEIYYQLPYFLKPGVTKWNEGEIALDNGCRIKAEATTEKSGIGMSISLCLMDEFGHVAPNILDKFYNNLLPVISATKGRVIITSTQNGYNLFYRLWQAAKQGLNDYWPFEVTWDMIPEWNSDKHCWEKRDEAWHRRQVANYGSEEAFNAQFGTSFDVASNTLIASKILKKRTLSLKEFVHKQMDSLYSDYFWWDPDYDLENLRNDWIVITTDIAEGLGGDYTVNMINKLYISNGEVRSIAVGFFKCNTFDVPTCASIIRQFCVTYLDPMKFLFSIEYNLFGELYMRTLREEMNNDMVNYEQFSETNIVRYYADDNPNKYTLGVRMNTKTKLIAVTQFKQKYEASIINNQSTQFMNELQCFCDNKGNNTYQASFGHDDLVMSQLQMALVMDTPQFKELTSIMEMYDSVTSQQMNTDLYQIIGQAIENVYKSLYEDTSRDEESWRDRLRRTNLIG